MTAPKIKLELGSNIVRSYQRLSYTPWHALAEFVDNSTQSFENNKAALLKAAPKGPPPLEVAIVYDAKKNFLRISDTAMGMSFADLQNALRLGHPPAIASGRSQFGLGLKTAAFWLGPRWSVKTKKLGEDIEHHVIVDIERIAAGNLELEYRSIPGRDKSLHYTVVEIEKMHRQFLGRRLGFIKDYLRSMYRQDLREKSLKLEWGGVPLTWDEKIQYAKAKDGSEYVKPFKFKINDKPVHGVVGILAKGSRALAGFSLLHRGRVVKGWPLCYRPESIFGQVQGSNDLVNQRITGEIFVRDFDVSHTKDDILWADDELDQLEAKLEEEARDFITRAKEMRYRQKDDLPGPTDTEFQVAVDEMRAEVASPEFADQIVMTRVPPPEAAEQMTRPLVDAGAAAEPVLSADVDVGNGDKVQFAMVMSEDASPNDPYFVTETSLPGKVLIVVNRRHPHWAQVDGSAGVLNFLRHCMYDAIAEWQCRRAKRNPEPRTLLVLKDGLLRIGELIQSSSANE